MSCLPWQSGQEAASSSPFANHFPWMLCAYSNA